MNAEARRAHHRVWVVRTARCSPVPYGETTACAPLRILQCYERLSDPSRRLPDIRIVSHPDDAMSQRGRPIMAAQMRAARLHEPGRPMRVDQVERPRPRPTDVLVQVKACGVIPNMNAVFSGRYWPRLPPLPAIVGLDAAGIVAEVGAQVSNVAVRSEERRVGKEDRCRW